MPTVRPAVLAVVLLIITGVSTLTTRSAAQGGPEDSPRTTLAEFKKLVEAGNVVVIDVRGDQAYRAGHIPGAVSVPLETVAARAREWASETRPVVTYCS